MWQFLSVTSVLVCQKNSNFKQISQFSHSDISRSYLIRQTEPKILRLVFEHILKVSFQFIRLSGQFTVYSPYKEPLLDAYMTMKEQGSAVNVNLSETWLRSYQVIGQHS